MVSKGGLVGYHNHSFLYEPFNYSLFYDFLSFTYVNTFPIGCNFSTI